MYNVNELRRFQRIKTESTVKYRKAGSNDAQKEGVTRNLSGNGIFFIAGEAQEVNSLIEIHVVPGTSATPPLDAVIEVIRSNPGPSEGEFEIAGMIKSFK
ncbi:MAG: PilZ domain-containing protein [Gammaproteobacteria bacterium]|nr:PilZ domain-containing protein [Gammaproteobacteria bacterium]